MAEFIHASGYITRNVILDKYATIDKDLAISLIGKTIVKIQQQDNEIIITFDNGERISICGFYGNEVAVEKVDNINPDMI